MSGINVVLVSDFLVGFAIAWILRGICDRLENKISNFFNRKKPDHE